MGIESLLTIVPAIAVIGFVVATTVFGGAAVSCAVNQMKGEKCSCA